MKYTLIKISFIMASLTFAGAASAVTIVNGQQIGGASSSGIAQQSYGANNGYSSNIGQQQSSNNQTSSATTKSTIPADTKTAAEQGYVDPSVQAQEKEAMENYQYYNTARQKGEVVDVPTSDDGVAKNKKMKMWLFNWKGRLMDKGISSQKIDFEAGRLNADEFSHWASRQIRYADSK